MVEYVCMDYTLQYIIIIYLSVLKYKYIIHYQRIYLLLQFLFKA